MISLYFTYSIFCLLYSLPSSIALISLFTVNKQVVTVNKQMGVLGGPNKQLAGPLDKELPHARPRVAEIRADQVM